MITRRPRNDYEKRQPFLTLKTGVPYLVIADAETRQKGDFNKRGRLRSL